MNRGSYCSATHHKRNSHAATTSKAGELQLLAIWHSTNNSHILDSIHTVLIAMRASKLSTQLNTRSTGFPSSSPPLLQIKMEINTEQYRLYRNTQAVNSKHKHTGHSKHPVIYPPSIFCESEGKQTLTTATTPKRYFTLSYP